MRRSNKKHKICVQILIEHNAFSLVFRISQMRVDLPFDVHLIILSYLDKLDKHQYGLVCKQWYEPAKHAIFRVTSVTVEKKLDAFVDALATSNIGNYISELRLYMGHRTKGWSPSLMEKRKKQFAALIKHTPI